MKLTDDLRLVISICRMHYEENISQKEISEKLSLSRPQVSRAIAYARQEGLVSIRINNPFSEETEYEKLIVKEFGLRDALVVNISSEDPNLRDVLSEAVRSKMDGFLSKNRTIGLMSGKSIAYITDRIGTKRRKNASFVPLVGGMGAAGAEWHASDIARKLAEKTGGRSYVLNAPLVVTTPEAKEMLEREPEISSVRRLASECEAVIIGVGEVGESATIVKSGALTRGDILNLKKLGAVAAIGCGFLDSDGTPLENELTGRCIGIKVQELQECPNVLAVAYGRKKADAVRAVLKSGIVHDIITTVDTVKKIFGY